MSWSYLEVELDFCEYDVLTDASSRELQASLLLESLGIGGGSGGEGLDSLLYTNKKHNTYAQAFNQWECTLNKPMWIH